MAGIGQYLPRTESYEERRSANVQIGFTRRNVFCSDGEEEWTMDKQACQKV